VTPTRPVTLLVKQAGATAPDALERGLRAAGLDVVLAPSPLDAVTDAARTPGGLRYLVLGVDYFGPEQFRLFPLFRREWPDTVLVAYHSAGFEHKGRIARLVGADVVLARPEDVFYFLETLPAEEPVVEPAAAAIATPEPPPEAAVAAVEPLAEPPGPEPATVAEPAERPPLAEEAPIAEEVPAAEEAPSAEDAAPAAEPPPEEAPAPQPPHELKPPPVREAVQETAQTPGPPFPDPPHASAPGGDEHAAATEPAGVAESESAAEPPDDGLGAGTVLGTIELTDEELRVLLGEDDDA
jgi:hypothetical protein